MSNTFSPLRLPALRSSNRRSPQTRYPRLMLTRRNLLAATAAAPLSAATGRMFLCMHQTTSAGSTFRASLEGYARAGIRYVEITQPMIAEFVNNGSIVADAKRMMTDLGLTAVSFGGVRGLAEPH